MISEQLQKKIDQSIRLIKATCSDEVVEVAYSGGKDSDVILQLAKESGVNYRAIYKNTTIDPPGTLKHCRDMGVEIIQPKPGKAFFRLVEKKGYPNRNRRFCCRELKEYKVLDRAILGVRKAESVARSKRYDEPTKCRIYGCKDNHANHIYPILEWTTQDVKDFLVW